MISFEVETPDNLGKQVELLGKYDKISNRRLKQAADASTKIVQGAARQNAPVFQARLRQSIDTEVREMGNMVQGRVFSPITKPYPYPLVMELGRKPGKMPPPSSLRRWVQLVIKPGADEVDGVAFLVARAIGRKGIKGRFFMRKAVQTSTTRISQFFQKAADLTAEDMVAK